MNDTEKPADGCGPKVGVRILFFLDELVLQSEAGGGAARIDIDLAVDRLDVGIDRIRAHNQLLSDLVVAHARGHQAQHLDFPRSQWLRNVWSNRSWRWFRPGRGN